MKKQKFKVDKHILTPKHSKLGEREKAQLLEKYHVTSKELPKILKTDAAIKDLDAKLGDIVKVNREIIPTIIPHNIEEFKIRLDKIWVEKPKMTEADGSVRNIYPMEARLRKITYSAPCWLTVSEHINGVQRESLDTQ